jgi:hypothetical protein
MTIRFGIGAETPNSLNFKSHKLIYYGMEGAVVI